jgi:hypothetical protein
MEFISEYIPAPIQVKARGLMIFRYITFWILLLFCPLIYLRVIPDTAEVSSAVNFESKVTIKTRTKRLLKSRGTRRKKSLGLQMHNDDAFKVDSRIRRIIEEIQTISIFSITGF